MGKTITKFKWFWAWQDEAEERWLGEMSKKGFHLISVSIPGIYAFRVDVPREYVYRLDYQRFTGKGKSEYLQLFQDAGWEYIGEMSAWQYFRKEVREGEVNEIFTDTKSKIAKYMRALTLMGFVFLLLSVIFWGQLATENVYHWWVAIEVFYSLITLVLAFSILKLALRIRDLRSHS